MWWWWWWWWWAELVQGMLQEQQLTVVLGVLEMEHVTQASTLTVFHFTLISGWSQLRCLGRGILIEQTLKPTFGCLQDLSSTQAEPNAFTPLLPLGFVRLPLHFDSSPLAVSEFVRGGSDHAWDNHWQEQQDEDEGEPQL
ncbi:hypothetical protein BKA82DRAFT_4012174 [Pisolithus tinctorius]|nr:hypothetical protein BKA82DRAFT_4016111 [Pisolithus tinctorius]KAI6154169.1 hypothetical protein BKA82DRAFT_4012174 [Pisolithus tinctorius]